MLEFITTPAIEWLEAEFYVKQYYDREYYTQWWNMYKDGPCEFRPDLFSIKDDAICWYCEAGIKCRLSSDKADSSYIDNDIVTADLVAG